MRTGRRVRREVGFHAVLVGAVCFGSLPIAWAVLTSFKPANAVFDLGLVSPTLANYVVAIEKFPIGRLLLNTVVTATAVTAMQLVVGALAGYGLVRFRVRSQRVVTGVLVCALLIPPQCLMIPQFLMIAQLGWVNSYAGLVVPQLAGCALATLLLRQHVRAIPATLFQAAEIDGATPRQALWHVALPALRPAMGAVGILVFITTWNEYLWPLLAAPAPEQTTIQVGLQSFMTEQGTAYGPLLAAAVLATAPVLLIYAFCSRRIVDAFLQSGLH